MKFRREGRGGGQGVWRWASTVIFGVAVCSTAVPSVSARQGGDEDRLIQRILNEMSPAEESGSVSSGVGPASVERVRRRDPSKEAERVDGGTPPPPTEDEEGTSGKEKAAPGAADEAASFEEESRLLDAVLPDVRFFETDLLSALNRLAEELGVIVDLGGEIRGKVTWHLKEVSGRDALTLLTAANRLAFRVEDGMVRILDREDYRARFGRDFIDGRRVRIVSLHHLAPAEAAGRLAPLLTKGERIFPDVEFDRIILLASPSTIDRVMDRLVEEDVLEEERFVSLRHLSPSEAGERLRGVLPEGLKSVEVDPEGGLRIVGEVETVRRAVALLKEWDQPRKILLLARVERLLLNEDHPQGVDWEAIVEDYRSAALRPGGRPLSLGTITREDYQVLLDALDLVGDRFSPATLGTVTTEGKGFRVVVSAGSGGVVLSLGPDGADRLLGDEERESLQGLASLRIVPRLREEGGLAMEIRPLSAEGPIVSIPVKEDEILVLGGMFEEEKEARTRKVPLLGDLPLVGGVFRGEVSRTRRRETVVFLGWSMVDETAP